MNTSSCNQERGNVQLVATCTSGESGDRIHAVGVFGCTEHNSVSTSTEYVVINATDQKVYFYTAANETAVALTSVLAADNQVATLTGVTATELVDANFIGN